MLYYLAKEEISLRRKKKPNLFSQFLKKVTEGQKAPSFNPLGLHLSLIKRVSTFKELLILLRQDFINSTASLILKQITLKNLVLHLGKIIQEINFLNVNIRRYFCLILKFKVNMQLLSWERSNSLSLTMSIRIKLSTYPGVMNEGKVRCRLERGGLNQETF